MTIKEEEDAGELIGRLRAGAEHQWRSSPSRQLLEEYLDWQAAARIEADAAALAAMRIALQTERDNRQHLANDFSAAREREQMLERALTAAKPYLENLVGYSTGHVPQTLRDTLAAVDAALAHPSSPAVEK